MSRGGGLPAAARPVAHVVLIVLMAVAVYANTLDAPFEFDDSIYIVENPLVRDLGVLLHPSTAEGKLERDVASTVRTRFMGYLSFLANYRLGGLSTWGYHAVNLAIHVLNALLLYALISLAMRTPIMEGSALKRRAPSVALGASLLFAVHPIQTQAVTYIAQRFTSLSALFYLLSMVLYARYRLSASGGAMRKIFYLLCLCAAVLAMHTKEIAFTLPLSVCLYEFTFFRGGPPRRRMLPLAPLLLSMLIIPMHIVDFEKPFGFALEEATSTQPLINNQAYLITQFRVMAVYLRLMLWPVNQNIDYDFPVYNSLLNADVLIPFLIMVSVLALGVLLSVRPRGRPSGERLVGFGILWFLLALSVESSFVALADVIFEHRLYLPGAGAFTAFAAAVATAHERMAEGRKRTALKVLAVMVMAALSVAAFARNDLWRSGVRLWRDSVAKSPGKARPLINLGSALAAQGLYDEAIENFRAALAREPGYALLHYDLGHAYQKKGDDDRAMYYYHKAVALDPGYVKAHNNLGVLYARRGMMTKAEMHYRRAAALDPAFPEAAFNLGIAYEEEGRLNEALAELRRALALAPGASNIHKHLGNVYFRLDRPEEAEGHYRKALELDPGNADALGGLGLLLMQLGRTGEASELLERAASLEGAR